MANSYVTEGAKLKCSQGSAQTELTVSKKRCTYIDGKPQANVCDSDPTKNLKPFGSCSKLHGACKPAPNKVWSNGKKDVVIEGGFALMQSSVLFCKNLGRISIVQDGQPEEKVEKDRAIGVQTVHQSKSETGKKDTEIGNQKVLVDVTGVSAQKRVVLLMNVKVIDKFQAFASKCLYKITIIDCFRDIRKQRHFYCLRNSPRNEADRNDFLAHRIKNKVSRPYKSYHNAGLAFDINYTAFTKKQLEEIEKVSNQFGFYRTQLTNDANNEPGHFAYTGGMPSRQQDAIAISLGYKDWKDTVDLAQKCYKELGHSLYVCPHGNTCGLDD